LDTTVTTEHLAEGIAADYDADGRLAGIEILDARKRFNDPQVLRQVILEDIGLATA
jgi:YD repeat-containing protein